MTHSITNKQTEDRTPSRVSHQPPQEAARAHSGLLPWLQEVVGHWQEVEHIAVLCLPAQNLPHMVTCPADVLAMQNLECFQHQFQSNKSKKKKKVKYFPLQQIKKVFTRKRPDKVELKSSVIVKLLSTLKQPRECSASGLSDRSPAGNRGRHLQWHLYLFTGLDIREPLSSSREFHSALLLLHQVELKVKHLSLQADY